MATAIQWRRGNTSQHANFTGLSGEITVDTDLNTLIVHDGSTAGGYRLAKYSEITALGTGDITNVIAGSGLTGGSESGNATLAIDYANIAGNLIPAANNTYTLGNATTVWKDVYVGPGSLYVNGQQVLSDNSGTIQFTANANQNVGILTSGSGDIELNASGTGTINLQSSITIDSGATLTATGGLTMGSNINVNSNYINNLGTPVANTDAATKGYVDTRDTDDFSEGATNLYYTTARHNTDFDTRIATKDTDDLTEGLLNLYYTTARANTAINDFISGGTGISVANGTITAALTPFDTSDLTEGTNLYYTTARANSAVEAYLSGSTGITFSSGVISVDGTVVQTSGAQTIAGAKTFSDDVVLNGNLTVNGTTVTVNTETLYLEDNIITLNYGTTGAATENAGIQVDRGDDNDVLLRWNESDNTWTFTNDGATYYPMPTDTDDLAEGASNLYWTTARGNAAMDAYLSGGTGISISSGTITASLTAFDTDDLSEGVTNQYWTSARGNAAMDAYLSGGTGVTYSSGGISIGQAVNTTSAVTFSTVTANLTGNVTGDVTGDVTGTVSSIANHDTDDLSEGATNLYYTDARARGAISVSGDLSYNSTTGVISFTNDAGDIESVTAGTGLTGGGASGAVTLNIGTGSGIIVNADNVAVDASYIRGLLSASGDLSYNASTGAFSFTNDAGDIESVTAGSGLTGGGTSGAVTLNVGAGTGISVAADSIAVDMTAFDTDDLTEGATNQYFTNARADARVNAVLPNTGSLSEGSNLYYTVARANTAIDARVTKSFVDALGINATLLDGIDSTAFLRSNAADSHSGTITPSTNNSINLGSTTLKYANVYATTFQGTATSAQYADLAEKYETDEELDAGTVVCFGGEKEVTACDHEADHRVAGVISTDPAYMMNAGGEGQYIALTGRVPCKVTGPVAKGDLMVSSSVKGHAKADNNAAPGRIIGKAVGSSEGGEAVIEVLVNMM